MRIGLVASGIVGLAVLGLVGLVVAGLFAAEAIDTAAGCGSVDPTDAANYSEVTIVNDTARAVVVDACVGAYCHPDALPATLVPGKTLSDDAACGATGADMTSWRIRRPDGTLVGYIAVASPKSRSGLTYDVSTAGPSRSTPTDPAFG